MRRFGKVCTAPPLHYTIGGSWDRKLDALRLLLKSFSDRSRPYYTSFFQFVNKDLILQAVKLPLHCWRWLTRIYNWWSLRCQCIRAFWPVLINKCTAHAAVTRVVWTVV